MTAENFAEREGLLRWTLISLAWGGALKEHIAEVQALKKQSDAAQQAGDIEALRKVMSRLAGIAAELLVKHEFVEGGDE